MNCLCFDISSGGISAAVFNSALESIRFADTRWNLETDERGAATLSSEGIAAQFKQTIRELNLANADGIDAICIGSFLHSCVLLDDADRPLTSVFTWLDRRGALGVDFVRSRLGDAFHERTGCRFHPLFPIFKLVAIQQSQPELLQNTRRVVSIKAFLTHRLTGEWVEDHGTASASGLFNIRDSAWDSQLLALAGLNQSALPPLRSRTDTIGRLTLSAARELGLRQGIAVINGSGDGFLANVGSGCEEPEKISVTLGTSAVARQTLPRPVLDSGSGTFCYKADENMYLLGCAGSNGGNVLDWGRAILGAFKDGDGSADPPIFIPLLHGERSPEWNPELTGSWHRLKALHTAADLSRSILEGVMFNLAHFVEIVQKTSGEKASGLVLSGNGFLQPLAAPILAEVSGLSVWMPAKPGFASLRGAGICALRGLGEPVPPLKPDPVSPFNDGKILERYTEYRRRRARLW